MKKKEEMEMLKKKTYEEIFYNFYIEENKHINLF